MHKYLLLSLWVANKAVCTGGAGKKTVGISTMRTGGNNARKRFPRWREIRWGAKLDFGSQIEINFAPPARKIKINALCIQNIYYYFMGNK